MVAGNIVVETVGSIFVETESAVRCCRMQDFAVEHKLNQYGRSQIFHSLRLKYQILLMKLIIILKRS